MYRKSTKLLNELESAEYFDESQMKALHGLAFSKNRETRARAAALLGRQYDNRSEEILCRLTYDRDEIVRLEAVDSLSIGKTEASLQRLERLSESSDFYIRYFAVQSHFDVYVNIWSCDDAANYLPRIKKQMEEEESLLVKLALYKIACLCGECGAFDKIVDILTHAMQGCNYSLISPALHMLDEIMEEPSHELGEAIRPFLSALNECQYELTVSMIDD